MDIGTEISLGISVTAVCVTVIFGMAIWRKSTIDEYREKSTALEKELETCRRELSSQRDENHWFRQRVQRLEERLQGRSSEDKRDD